MSYFLARNCQCGDNKVDFKAITISRRKSTKKFGHIRCELSSCLPLEVFYYRYFVSWDNYLEKVSNTVTQQKVTQYKFHKKSLFSYNTILGYLCPRQISFIINIYKVRISNISTIFLGISTKYTGPSNEFNYNYSSIIFFAKCMEDKMWEFL
jgi:hypothetical protein